AIARSCNVVMLLSILHGEGYPEHAAKVLHIERCKAGRDRPIGKPASRVEVLVVPLHDAGPEVRGIKKVATPNASDGKPLVHGAGGCSVTGIVDFKDRVVQVDVWIPAGDRAVFRREKEAGGLPFGHLEIAGAVKYGPGWRRSRAWRRVGRWDGHHKRERGSVRIEGGHSGPVIGNPEWGRWAGRDSPRVDKMRIDVLGSGHISSDPVGDEVGLLIRPLSYR